LSEPDFNLDTHRPNLYNKSMSVEYFEDIKLHQIYRSREYHLIEKDIIDFARKWDPQPIHVDPEAAKKTKLGGLCATGLHLMGICGKLLGEKKSKPAMIAGTGLEKVQFLAPARPGDILVMEIETTAKRESKSNPNSGTIKISTRLLNQKDKAVLAMESNVLVAKRPKP
jgi:acyl dehydratase